MALELSMNIILTEKVLDCIEFGDLLDHLNYLVYFIYTL